MKNNESINSLITVAVILLLMISVTLLLFAGGIREDSSRNAIENVNADKMLNFLFIGRDDGANLCDVIILASVNTATGDTNMLHIPRDTYFNYTDASYKKINGAPRALGSAENFARALSSAMNVYIDHYVSIDLKTVSDMVDMVSGVEVDVPIDMDYDDPDQNLSIHLKAGKQTLDGKSAMQFVRYRSGYITGDIGRIDAQKLFINAFLEKVAKVGNPVLFYKMFKLVVARSDTDMSEQTMISLALNGMGKNGKVCYVTLPGEATRSEKSGAWYYVLSRESTAELLTERFGMRGGEKDFDKSEQFVDKTAKLFYDIYCTRHEYIIYDSDDIENDLTNIN